MKIGIDARFYGPVGKGLGRYTQEVVDNIIKITTSHSSLKDGQDISFVIFLSSDNFDEFIVPGVNIKKVKLTCSWYSWSEQLLFPYYIWREHLELIHFPHFNVPLLTPTKFVVTIHDLILTHFPTMRATQHHRFRYYLKNFAYRLVILVALKRAKRIITVSQFTKQDIIKEFGIKPSKIIVIYEGVANLSASRDSLFVAKLDNEETLTQYHIPNNFLLYVGNAYPHKNLESLLRVFSRLQLERPKFHLVLVGKIDYFYKRIQNTARILNLWQVSNANSPVIFPGYVPDAQLEIFYAEAQVYIFPSLYEGFGLPPLEAMAQACPVLSSNQASLPEVLGRAALYFNPRDEEDMLNKIKIMLDDKNKRMEFKKRGLLQVKKYSWWECARLTLEVYQLAIKSKKLKI